MLGFGVQADQFRRVESCSSMAWGCTHTCLLLRQPDKSLVRLQARPPHECSKTNLPSTCLGCLQCLNAC